MATFHRHLPSILRAKRLEVLCNVIALQHAARVEDKFDKLDSMVVRGQRRVCGQDGIRHGLDHGLLEVEELVDDKTACEISHPINSLSKLVVRDAGDVFKKLRVSESGQPPHLHL
jgi:hypothetical protein